MKTIEVAEDARDAWLEIERHGWGDGLPCVPPTEALVDAMIGGRDPDERVGRILPSGEWATVGLIAVNAVMAGCEPAAMPLVMAAVRASADPAFNLLAVQSTTNPTAQTIVVNGPVAEELGITSGAGCMGAGQLANLTAGRAVRLVMTNVGNARPGVGDRATHGYPGKIACCFAEAEDASPWEPLHVSRGLDRAASAVTVVSGSGTLNLLDTSDDGEELLLAFGRAMAYPSSNDYLWGGTAMLILGPEHAAVIAAAGFDRESVQRLLWEHSAMPASQVTRQNMASFLAPARGALYEPIDADTPIHVTDGREDIVVAVAGGPGTHSVYVPTFGDSKAVTMAVGG